MKKIGIIGHFGGNKDFYDGQTVKTKNCYRALCEEYGSDNIVALDTYGYKKHFISFFYKSIKIFFSCKNLLILPDSNGVRVFVPMYGIFKSFFKKNVQYDVIGGWLPEFFKKHKILKFFAKRLDVIYVETSSMKEDLENDDFRNVALVPNFKYLAAINKEDLVYSAKKPLRLCVFSRIMKEKGVEDAINVVNEINQSYNETVYALDIYGPVDDGYTERFNELKADFPDYINYKGVVPFDKSVEIIKNYFTLLFPTRFYTEGVPGTLIDAMAAGVPVISSLWVNHKDVFIEDITGWGYEFENITEFKQLLIKAAEKPKEFSKMKTTSLKEYEKYKPEVVIKEIVKRMT